jgi:hypothetical protein
LPNLSADRRAAARLVNGPDFPAENFLHRRELGWLA